MKLVSYDIFDTCLVRDCGNPLVIYDLLAKRVLGNKVDGTSLTNFVLERRRAEIRARSGMGQGIEDVSLDQIYDCADFSPYTQMPKEAIERTELLIEEEHLWPVKEILDEINNQRKSGFHVAFISDMYLPKKFISHILTKFGFLKENDDLFISSEVKLTKRSGHLYDFVKNKLNVAQSSWTHYGDNLYSDVRVPKHYGIKARHKVVSYTPYERIMCHKDVASCVPYQGHIMAAISRAVRCTSNVTEHNHSYEYFAAEFVAPLLTSYIHWVLEDAKSRKLKDLFFVSRDGYIIYLIAKKYKELYPAISLHYIRLSRKSLYLPAMEDLSLESIVDILADNKLGVSEILDRLQMNNYKIHFKPNGKGTKEIVSQLLNDKVFRLELSHKRDIQKELCLKYFRQEGMGLPNAALVDIRGGGRCQDSVNSILKSAGLHPIFGYYFEVTSNRVLKKGYNALYCDERLQLNLVNNVISPADLFEQYFCMTDQQRTACYKEVGNKVEPVFDINVTNKDYKELVYNYHLKICDIYAQIYKNYIQILDPKVSISFVVSSWSYFYNVPDKKLLNIFKDLRFTSSYFIVYPLIRKQSWLKILLKRKDEVWSIGDLVYNIPYLLNPILKLILNFKYLAK